MAKNPLIRKVPKMTGKTTGGHKSAGILDDHAVRKVISAIQGIFSRVHIQSDEGKALFVKKADGTHVFRVNANTSKIQSRTFIPIGGSDNLGNEDAVWDELWAHELWLGDYVSGKTPTITFINVCGTPPSGKTLLYNITLSQFEFNDDLDITGEVSHTGADSTYNDNYGTVFGTGYDAEIYYNNTNLVINPSAAGSGIVLIGATGDKDLECANLTADQFRATGDPALLIANNSYPFALNANQDTGLFFNTTAGQLEVHYNGVAQQTFQVVSPYLVSLGTNVKFGTYSSGEATITGWIEITDAGGTPRKLLVG